MIGPLFDMSTAAMFIFFLGNSYMCASLEQQCRPLTDWPTWIDILWKWAGMLIKLAGDGECRVG